MLPAEIMHHILAWLPCRELVLLGRVCRQLRDATAEDLLWQRLLRPNIAGRDFPHHPFPSNTFRDLYITHHPYWFVARNKIWISDDPFVGRIMLCKFDPRRGCIEGYRLLAERGASQTIVWPHLPGVVIHTFNPHVRLWLDDPVLKLAHNPTAFRWWEDEICMSIGRPGHNISASFFLSRDLPDCALHPSMVVWPPRSIPNMPRVRASSGDDKLGAKAHKPQRYDQISQTTFRMRNWSQFALNLSTYGIRIGEQVTTWSTLDPGLYTPTEEKPYQGIFVGDYAGHGCEFLLVMQTDGPAGLPGHGHGRRGQEQDAAAGRQQHATDPESGPSSQPPSSSGTQPPSSSAPQPPSSSATLPLSSSATLPLSPSATLPLSPSATLPLSPSILTDLPATSAIHDDPSIFRGAIEAVKLTGDPNVPRGEHSFIAEDIGPAGFIRTAMEKPFVGARVVRSRGHVAARGFVHDEFIPSQLLLISHDRLAQYWVPYGHISFYNRVDIDDLINTTFGP
ncbi:hypothetical protein DV737_g1850, partial [Chaetothyriales sp. CBS 132003]